MKVRPGGRPKLSICAGDIEALASVGLVASEIAAIMDCSRSLVEGRFREYLDRGREKRNSSLRRKQYELAMDGNVTMLIWLGKQCLGQRDKLEHSGDAEKPIEVRGIEFFYGAGAK